MKEVVNGSFSKTRELIRNVNRTEVKSHRPKATRNRKQNSYYGINKGHKIETKQRGLELQQENEFFKLPTGTIGFCWIKSCSERKIRLSFCTFSQRSRDQALRAAASVPISCSVRPGRLSKNVVRRICKAYYSLKSLTFRRHRPRSPQLVDG